MDAAREDLYFSRIMPPNDAPWTFQLLSVPLSTHAADERFSDAPQWSDDLHLIHAVDGRGILHIGKEQYEATPSTVLAVPVFQHCRWEKRGGGPWTMLNLHARIVETDGTPLHEQSPLPTSFRPGDLPAIHQRLALMQQHWTTGTALDRSIAASDAMALIGRYLAEFGRRSPAKPTGDPRMQRLRDLLQQNAGGRFDATILARQMALSVSQCNRRFRASFGMSPKAYWQRCRFALAQSMLTGHLGQRQAGRRYPRLRRHLLLLALVQTAGASRPYVVPPPTPPDVEAGALLISLAFCTNASVMRTNVASYRQMHTSRWAAPQICA